MVYFNWLRKKRDNKWQVLVAISLLTIFFIWKAIIQSWHLIFYIVCLILWIVAYSIFEYIQKKMLAKPASLWKVYAKKYPIIVQYIPPKWVNPAEAWLLYNRSVEPTDLTSLIYQWKFEKLIDIKMFKWENSNKDYIQLIKLDDMPLTRPLFESEIFDSIFRMGNIKVIEWAFQLRYALMLEDLEYHWIQKWRLTYGKNKEKKKINSELKSSWNISVELIIFLLYFFMSIFSIVMESLGISTRFSINLTEFLWWLVIVFCIVMWIILFYWKHDGRAKLKYTDKWAELASQVIWYSQFIKSCDENKIKMFLKEDPLFIDRTLPYATAFWMETEFLNKISPLKKDWNAKYVRWTKVPSWVWILRFLVKDENSWF